VTHCSQYNPATFQSFFVPHVSVPFPIITNNAKLLCRKKSSCMLIDTADPQTFLQPSSSFHRYATVCVSQKNGDASSIPAQILNLIIAPSQLYSSSNHRTQLIHAYITCIAFPDFARRLDVKVSVTVSESVLTIQCPEEQTEIFSILSVVSTTRSIIIHASFLIPTLRDSNSDICYELNISIVSFSGKKLRT
ncbi:hypothetical protein HHX47_DHR1001064, partial [Lentinula edodes]